jgi:transposase-like protein
MPRNHYPPELIETLVNQVLEEQHPLTQVARSVGIHPGVLSKWVKHARSLREIPLLAPQTNSSTELASLHKRVAVLEERLDTLRGVLEKLLSAKYKHGS